MATRAIEVRGPATASQVVWRLGPQHRMTLIAKVTAEYDGAGIIRPRAPRDLIGVANTEDDARCELAPFLRGSQITCLPPFNSDSTHFGLKVSRRGTALVKRVVSEPGALGPIPSVIAGGLASLLHGDAVIEPGTDGALLSTAPPEQRLRGFEGDETIHMAGLDPEAGAVEMALPSFNVHFTVKLGEADVPFDVRMDTVTIKPSERRLEMLWRGSFPIRPEQLDELTISLEVTMSQSTAVLGTKRSSSNPTLPFAKGQFRPEPAGDAPQDFTGTVNIEEPHLPQKNITTPFAHKAKAKPKRAVTAAMSVEELKRQAAQSDIPFESGLSAPQRASGPIPGAPWDSGTADAEVVRPVPGASRTIIQGREDAPPSETPPPPEPREAPPDPEEVPQPPEEKKTAEEIERERPKTPWVTGPELDLEAAKAKPKRAPRKDLNELLYGKKK